MYITEHETLHFVDILHNILKNYNTRKHSFLNASPFQVETNKNLQFKTIILHSEKYAKVKTNKKQFTIGTIVRV